MSEPERRSRPAYEIALLLALGQEGCPICHQVANSDDHYFFWFFNESCYEPHTLDALSRSLGFCLAHGGRLAGAYAGSYQLAAVHEVLVGRVRRRLSDRADEAARDALMSYNRCPPCQDRAAQVERNAFWLAGILEDPSAADRYANPGALCFPHLRVVLPRVSKTILERLLAVHEPAAAAALESLTELRAELGRSTFDGHQDLIKTLLPFLHLAVGHEPGNNPYPFPDKERGEPRRDPVGDFLARLGRAEACPVCLEVRGAWLEWTRWLDDAAHRDGDVDDLLPTCPEHAWPAVRQSGAFLAMATAQKALRAVLGQLRVGTQSLNPPPGPGHPRLVRRLRQAVRGPRFRLRMAREALTRPLRCPVCDQLVLAGDRALALLFALVEDRQHRAAFEGSYGLCLRHFSRALALEPPPQVRAVVAQVEAAKLARLGWELEESLRKVGWNFRPESKGTEQTAWRRAVVRFSGSLGGEAG